MDGGASVQGSFSQSRLLKLEERAEAPPWSSPHPLSRKAIITLASRNVGGLNCFIQGGNMIAEHSHDAAEVRLRSGACLQFAFIQAGQLGFYLSRILQGRRTLGFQQL
jgi:hypothetical protein